MGIDEEIAEAVHKHGWQLISINDKNKPFQYSTGFMPQHPEAIVFGLESKIASNVLNSVGRHVKQNEVFEHKGIFEIEAEPNKIAVRRVHATQIPLYFGYAMGFCRISNLGDVQAVQLFWSDDHGRFPFDAGCAESVYCAQPRLDIGLSPREVAIWERLWE